MQIITYNKIAALVYKNYCPLGKRGDSAGNIYYLNKLFNHVSRPIFAFWRYLAYLSTIENLGGCGVRVSEPHFLHLSRKE